MIVETIVAEIAVLKGKRRDKIRRVEKKNAKEPSMVLFFSLNI